MLVKLLFSATLTVQKDWKTSHKLESTSRYIATVLLSYLYKIELCQCSPATPRSEIYINDLGSTPLWGDNCWKLQPWTRKGQSKKTLNSLFLHRISWLYTFLYTHVSIKKKYGHVKSSWRNDYQWFNGSGNYRGFAISAF
jgi:hypothetical protein